MSDLGSSLITAADPAPSAPQRPSRRRFWLIVAAIVLVVTSITGVVGITWYLKRKAPRDAFALARAGTEAASRNDHVRAAALFAEAVAKDPSQSNYLIGAAQSASIAGRKPEAKLYAQRAWDAGRHTTELMRLLLADTGTADRAKSLAAAECLLTTIADETERLGLQVEVLSELRSEEDADAAWRRLLARRQEPALITKFGHWLIAKGRVDAARSLLQQARKDQQLDAEGYYDLLNILHFDRLVSQLTPVGEAPAAPQEDLLGVVAEAYARQQVDDRLQFTEALLTFSRNELPKAVTLLSPLMVPVTDVEANRWRQQARLLLVAILIEMGRPQEVANLVNIPRGTGPEREGEDLLYVSLSSPDRKPVDRLRDIARVQKLLNDAPILTLIQARQYAVMGSNKDALACYGKLPNLFSTAAGPLMEQAGLMIAEGRSSDALGRILMVHRLYGTSRRSLMLMSQVVRPDADPRAGQVMQQLLVSAGQTDSVMLSAAAEFALGRGDYQTAEDVFARLSQRDAGDQQAVFGPVRVALLRQDWATALAKCEALPASTDRDVLRAIALRGQGKLAEALNILERISRDPHPVGIDLELGYTALAASNLTLAKAGTRRALAAAPDQVEVLELASATALAEANPTEALDYANRALAKGSTPVRERLRGEALVAIPKDGEAAKFIQAARTVYPEDAGLTVLQARVQLRLGHGEEARRALAELDRHQPGQLVVQRLLAECALVQGDLPRARGLVDQVMARAPDMVEHQLLRIRVIAQGGDLAVARSAIDALPVSVRESQRLLLHAWLDQLSGKTPAAIERLAGHLEDPAVALAWARYVLSVDAPAPEVAPVLAKVTISDADLLRLAAAAERRSRWRDAAALCGRVLARQPDDPALNNNWGWYAMQVPGADPIPVLAALEKAARLMPSNPGVVDSYSEALLWAGRPLVARNLLLNQGDLIARHPQLQHNLARALEATGDAKGAHAAFRRSQALAAAAESWPLRESREALAARLAGTGK